MLNHTVLKSLKPLRWEGDGIKTKVLGQTPDHKKLKEGMGAYCLEYEPDVAFYKLVRTISVQRGTGEHRFVQFL